MKSMKEEDYLKKTWQKDETAKTLAVQAQQAPPVFATMAATVRRVIIWILLDFILLTKKNVNVST
jgi:hypothetical protein